MTFLGIPLVGWVLGAAVAAPLIWREGRKFFRVDAAVDQAIKIKDASIETLCADLELARKALATVRSDQENFVRQRREEKQEELKDRSKLITRIMKLEAADRVKENIIKDLIRDVRKAKSHEMDVQDLNTGVFTEAMLDMPFESTFK